MKTNDKKIGKIQPVFLEEEVQSSYLDYAMSVIVSRALPDVRDGLKPVHRRILYAMWQMGLRANAKFRKSAAVVGETLAKFHPHGDQAVYDSLARLAQDFSLRYPLVQGQGNFGSLEDPPAASRYTEAKLAGIAEEMLSEIEKETVSFVPNYDGTTKEPTVLPSKLPNLLLNGALGIAVGMATNIPTHNLSEVCDSLIHLIDHPKAEIDDLLKFIKGPDFPTGGLIYNPQQIKEAYTLGRGPIVVRAKAEIIENENRSFQIIIKEIPFQVNKTGLLEQIAKLIEEKKFEEIRDIRDESSQEGVRIIIELKKNTYPQKVLARLFKLTGLQQSFHLNLVALADGIQPRLFNLKEILEEYLKHRQIVIRQRTEYDLRQTKERIHILEGFKIALTRIEEVIAIIKKSKDRAEAKTNLIKKFKFSDRQTEAILEMRLHQLANLERLKIEAELKEKIRLAKSLEEILTKTGRISQLIKDELRELKEKYGDERRTKVVSETVDSFKEEDLIPDQPVLIIITRDNYIKSLSPESFRTQGRGGVGVIGLETKEEDRIEILKATTSHANLLFFTDQGRVFQLKAYDIPQGTRTARGQAVVNFLQIKDQEKISAILPVTDLGKYQYLIMATQQGLIKKIEVGIFKQVRRSGLKIINLNENDHLKWVKPISASQEIMLATAGGQAIRFKEKDLRLMGRAAAGVKGIRLRKGDEVRGMQVVESKKDRKDYLLVITENGFGKMTLLNQYRPQRRGGTGIKTARPTEKTGQVRAVSIIYQGDLDETEKRNLLIISNFGQMIRLPLKSLPILGRMTQGVRLMKFKEKGEQVASVALI